MTRGRPTLRTGTALDAKKLHALIQANLEDGHLLPRTLGEVSARAPRFVVASRARKLIGCAELVPLSPRLAEVRSLVVDAGERRHSVGTMIVDELRRRAQREGFEKLCAFTHTAAYFINMGFSIVPHSSLPEKIVTACLACQHFRHCDQDAMVVPLESVRDIDEDAVPLAPYA